MKQTNNAIKFLVAQYRAIFKNAYVKGIATALVVTAGLAAGQAQAAIDNTTFPNQKDTVTVNTGSELQLKAATADAVNLVNFNDVIFNIVGGNPGAAGSPDSGNFLHASGAALTVTAEKATININGAAAANGLALKAAKDKTLTAKFKEINVNQGKLDIDGTGKVDLTVDSFKVGGAAAAAKAAVPAVVSFTGTSGALTVKNALTLGAKGSIAVVAATEDATAAVKATTLSMTDGAINVTGSSSATKAGTLDLTVDSGSITGGTISVVGGTGKTVGGANLNIKFDGTTKKLTVADEAQIKIGASGAVTVSGGTLSASNKVFGTTAQAGTLKVDNTGTLETDTGIAKLVNVDVASGGILDLKGANVDLTAATPDIKFDTTTAAGTVQVAAGSIVKVGDLTVSNTAQGAVGNFVVNTLKVTDKATLSGSTYTIANGLSLAAETTVNTTLDFDNAAGGAIADNGSIVLAGANGKLQVAEGAWTSPVNVTVGSDSANGIVNIGSKAGASGKKVVSSLTMDAGTSFTLKSGTITVGSGADTTATLDLSQADTVSLKDAAAASEIKVQSGGALVLKGTDAVQLTDATNLKTTIAKDSFLKFVGDATLNTGKLKGSVTNNGDFAVIGTVESDGTLTLTGKSLQIADTGVIKANTVKFSDQSNAYTVSGGSVTAVSGLDLGSAGTLTVSGTGVGLNLGVAGTSSAGTVTGKVDVKTGTATVVAGSWTAGEIALSGKLADSKLVVSEGASLTASKLALTSGTATINGNVTVDSLSTLDSANTVANVAGTLTINGIAAAAEGQPENNNGIKVGEKSLAVSAGGNVIITGEALKQVDTTASGSTGFAKGAVTLVDGATLKVDYAEGKTLSADEVNNLRKNLTGTQTDNAAGKGFIDIGLATLKDVTFVEGSNNTQIEWSEAKKYADINATNSDLSNATVVGIKTADNDLKGSLGSLQTADNFTSTEVTLAGSTKLSNAAGNGGKFVSKADGTVLGLNAGSEVKSVELNGGGQVGVIKTTATDSKLIIDSKASSTVVDAIAAKGEVSLNGAVSVTNKLEGAKVAVNRGKTTVGGDVKATGTFDIAKDASADIAGNLTVTQAATVEGDLKAKNATFNNAAKLTGNVTVAGPAGADGTLTAKNTLAVEQGTTKAATVKLSASGANVQNGGTLVADVLETSGNVFVGQFLGENAAAGSAGSVGTGYLEAGRLDLNNKDLVVDPAWGENASIAAIDKFGKVTDAVDTVTNGVSTNGGLLKGNVYALQNAVVGIGADLAETKAALTAAKVLVDGKLSNDASKVGAAVYVAKSVKVANGSKIVVDKAQNQATYNTQTVQNAYASGDLYLGAGSALVVSDAAALHSTKAADGSQEAAVVFDKNNASVYVEQGGSVVLAGSGYGVASKIALFRDKGADQVGGADTAGVKILGNDLVVKSANGLFTHTFTKDTEADTNSFTLTADKAKIKKSFGDASTPAYETAVKYALGFGQLDNTFAGVPGTELKGQTISKAEFDALTKEEQAEFTITNKDGSYSKAYNNALLNAVVMDGTSAKDIDTLTRAGAFSGVAHATVAAGTSTAGAIGARFGLGSTPSNVTAASNNVGGALFVAPIYASMDSDGFAAQGTNYGVDVDLYGAAIGADFEVAPGFRVGGVFNVGSGDTEGNGAAAGSKDDFKYYGFGLFAGYSVGAFSIVGDINYTMVDNDLELNFASIGKYSTSLDSTNLNVGVGAQYAMELGGLAVVPHAGVRYMRVEADDYSVTGVGSYAGSDVSVVAIPVGVTVAKAFVTDTFTVKPLFDLTLTSNLGDDELEGQFNWDGVNLETKVATEILDNFSYGATAGVAMETGNFAAAFGVNYTGSSNTDSFAVSASARYLF